MGPLCDAVVLRLILCPLSAQPAYNGYREDVPIDPAQLAIPNRFRIRSSVRLRLQTSSFERPIAGTSHGYSEVSRALCSAR